MSGETSLKFIIPESSCQKDFEVWALFADGAKESILRCDWIDKYYCDNAPGYTHTLENGTAVITLPRDLEKKPVYAICDTFFRPKTDPSWCLCKTADNASNAVCPSVSLLLMVVVVVVAELIGKYYRRTSPPSKHDPNVRPDEFEPLRDPNSRLNSPNPLMPPPIAFSTLNKETSEAFSQSSPAIEETRPQTGEPRMDALKFFVSDSQESSTPPTKTVPPKKITIIPSQTWRHKQEDHKLTVQKIHLLELLSLKQARQLSSRLTKIFDEFANFTVVCFYPFHQ